MQLVCLVAAAIVFDGDGCLCYVATDFIVWLGEGHVDAF